MKNFKKYSFYDKSEVFSTNVTTLHSGCKEHSWINTGITLQGISLKRCMKCGETKQAKSCQK